MPLGPRRIVRSTVNSNVKPTIACRIAEIHSLLGQYFQELAFKPFIKAYLQRPVRYWSRPIRTGRWHSTRGQQGRDPRPPEEARRVHLERDNIESTRCEDGERIYKTA